MRLILHDLPQEEFQALGLQRLPENETMFVSALDVNHYCVGCFACWLKTPGKCVINDKYQDMGEKLSSVNEFIIISKATFGSYSSAIKNVLDRSISYVKPFFVIRHGEMHHEERYKNKLNISAIFYGDCSPWERDTAENLVMANAKNLNAFVSEVCFVDSVYELKEVLS
jgi:multimeric flavodoxin WrbA